MTKLIDFLLGITWATALVLAAATAVYADQPEILKIDVCHATGSESNPYVLVNVSIHSVADADSVGGHGDHEDDAWEPYTYGDLDFDGQGDMALCEGAPTDEPEDTPEPTETEEPEDDPTATPDPTDAPEPTPTDVSEEPTSEPTPDSEDCEIDCEPTATPPVTEEPEQLPSAGFVSQVEIINGEPWQLSVPGNVWAGHNQADWPAGQWWMLWKDKEFYFNGEWYITQEYLIVDPTEVELIGRAVDFDLMLITCRGYDSVTNTWAERLVIFANLSE